MSKHGTIQAIRGMNDIGPDTSKRWLWLESTLAQMAVAWGYRMIRTPIAEKAHLFKRGVGDSSDIVQKEMYTFEDQGGDCLALRPEGTASCVRAGIEHGWLHNQRQKWFYIGPMFRRERPQKGRYRQFHHFGLETFGIPGSGIEAELLLFTHTLWQTLGVSGLKLHIHSLGDKESRARYREQLVTYFTQHKDALDEDSLKRLELNPLRILDSKVPQTQALVQQAPKLLDALSDEARATFDTTLTLLDQAGIAYHIDPYLVRGLDYYQDLVFEWISEDLGAQSTVCAGGRYDGLIELLGGNPGQACGFAIGIERLLALMPSHLPEDTRPTVYLGAGDTKEQVALLQLGQTLREQCKEAIVIVDPNPDKPKKHIKRANAEGATWFLYAQDALAEPYTVKRLDRDAPALTLTLEQWLKELETTP